eukprot:1346305-Amorphochlora_amoeboformis.AAC.2
MGAVTDCSKGRGGSSSSMGDLGFTENPGSPKIIPGIPANPKGHPRRSPKEITGDRELAMGAQCSGCCVVLGRQTCGCFGIGDPIKRVLITGRKGSGKTSLMYRLHSGVEFNAEKEPTIGVFPWDWHL